jgi:hypothetical protein
MRIALDHADMPMVIYALSQMPDGSWSIRRAATTLFSQLRLGAAIQLAREVARDEHLRSGRSVSVEMPGPVSSIRLAQYARQPVQPQSAVA